MKALVAVVGSAVAFVAAGVGITAMADATMSRHRTMPPGSATLVVADARTKGIAEHSLATMARALFLTCRLEVEADVVEESFRMDDDGRFEGLLGPALDESDERQLHGCLEDARVDNLQVEVRRLTRAR